MKYLFPFFSFIFTVFFLSCEEIVPTKDNILDPTNPDYEFSSLSGTVSNDRNNDLISNASIVLKGTDTTVSNSDGYYSFFNIIHGEHEIITTKDSFLISIDSIYIEPGEDKTYAITLSKDSPFLIISDTVFSVSPLESNVYFKIINDGVRILDWTIDNNNESLTSFPENGSISPKDSTTIQLSINKHLLNEGMSNLSFLINSNAGSKTIGLNVMVEPVLQVLTDQILFDFNEPSAEIKLCNPGGGNLEFSIEENSDWITLSHYSGIISADTLTIYAYADTSNLVYGHNSSVITINHSDNTFSLDCNIYSPYPASLQLSTQALDFGLDQEQLTFNIINSGDDVLSWSLENEQEFLSISQLSGQIIESQTITISVDRSSFYEGNYNHNLTINSNGGNAIITISFDVLPILSISEQTIDLGASLNAFSLSIQNIGSGILPWTINSGASWIEILSDNEGELSSNPYTIEGLVNRDGLSGGNYSSDIIVSYGENTQSLELQMYVPYPASLQLSTQALDFGLDQEQLTFNIINSGDDVLSWSLENEQEFLSISQLSGQIIESQTITISVDRSSFYEGNYNHNLTINSNGGNAIITISFDVLPILSISEQTIDLGASLNAFSLSIQNIGSGILPWTINSGASWIEILSDNEGELSSNPYTIEGLVNRDGLSGGNYSSDIIVSYGENTQSLELQMYVPYPPILTLSDSQLNFNRDNLEGELSIGNSGEGELVWSISENIAWLSVYPAQGTTQSEEDNITITINPNNASSGQSSGNIVITSNGGMKR